MGSGDGSEGKGIGRGEDEKEAGRELRGDCYEKGAVMGWQLGGEGGGGEEDETLRNGWR